MKRDTQARPWLLRSTLTVLALAALGAWAQETPTEGGQEKKDEKQDEKVEPTKWNEVSIGYTSISKGATTLSYDARPTEGLSLHHLSLLSPLSDTSPYARLYYNGFPNQDFKYQGFIALNHGHTVLRAGRGRYGRYEYAPGWQWPNDPSQDDVSSITIDHSISPSAGGFFTYKADERDARYPAPREPEHTRTKLIAGGVGGSALGGNLGVTAAQRTTADDTGFQPQTLQRRIDATYTADIGDRLSVEGAAGYARIEQAGLDSSTIRSYALAGLLDLGPATTLQFKFGRQDFDLNTIKNAYVRKRLVSGARLMQRWRGWSLQFGFNHLESERYRADQTFVDVPKTNVYDGRLYGRVGPFNLTVRGSWEDLTNEAQMQTTDTRMLQWDDRATFQAKLDRGTDVYSGYLTYTYRFQRNSIRDVEIGWHNLAVGGTYVVDTVLSAYAEYSMDDFRVIGHDESGIELDDFFPNSRSFAVGLNWSKDQNLSASAGLNYYESGDVKGTQLTFSVRRRLSPDHDLELVVAPWTQDDRLFDQTGYRTTFVMARLNVRF
ncbi:MAG: hypothetical protein JSS66_08100 [Armatimonadetes bacterium]|nr:hypothetical protein [Armatimonadota bacterium]